MMAKEGVGGDVDEVAEKFEGKLVVSLEDEDWEKMAAEFKWALVLKLANGMAFDLTGLSNALSKIWNLELDERVRFKELANNMAIAEFMSAADMIRVKDGGPWLCLGTVALIHDWCPDLAPEEVIMNRLGVWAQLHNLPIGAVMCDKYVGEKLACHIGRFVKVDSEGTEKKFVRVRVEIDINKPVVKDFLLRRPSRDPLWVSVKYERLPNLCSNCGRLSHEGEQCKEDKFNDTVDSEVYPEGEIVVKRVERHEHVGAEAGAEVLLEHGGKVVGETYTEAPVAEQGEVGARSMVKTIQHIPTPKTLMALEAKSQNRNSLSFPKLEVAENSKNGAGDMEKKALLKVHEMKEAARYTSSWQTWRKTTTKESDKNAGEQTWWKKVHEMKEVAPDKSSWQTWAKKVDEPDEAQRKESEGTHSCSNQWNSPRPKANNETEVIQWGQRSGSKRNRQENMSGPSNRLPKPVDRFIVEEQEILSVVEPWSSWGSDKDEVLLEKTSYWGQQIEANISSSWGKKVAVTEPKSSSWGKKAVDIQMHEQPCGTTNEVATKVESDGWGGKATETKSNWGQAIESVGKKESDRNVGEQPWVKKDHESMKQRKLH